MKARRTKKLKEYYFYKGGYKEITIKNLRNFRQERNFKVKKATSVEIYYSPDFHDERPTIKSQAFFEKN